MTRKPCLTSPITPRQRAIADRVMVGDVNKEIARELGISEGTVKTHVMVLMRKTRTTNRTALAVELLRAKYEGPQ